MAGEKLHVPPALGSIRSVLWTGEKRFPSVHVRVVIVPVEVTELLKLCTRLGTMRKLRVRDLSRR